MSEGEDVKLLERLNGYEALLADYADMLEKADDIGLNVMGNDLREVQAAISDAWHALRTRVSHKEAPTQTKDGPNHD